MELHFYRNYKNIARHFIRLNRKVLKLLPGNADCFPGPVRSRKSFLTNKFQLVKILFLRPGDGAGDRTVDSSPLAGPDGSPVHQAAQPLQSGGERVRQAQGEQRGLPRVWGAPAAQPRRQQSLLPPPGIATTPPITTIAFFSTNTCSADAPETTNHRG